MSEKKSSTLLPAITNKPQSSEKTSSRRSRKPQGTPHMNAARHLFGLRKDYSKKKMQEQATYLLSINYLQMRPRVQKSTLRDQQALKMRTHLKLW